MSRLAVLGLALCLPLMATRAAAAPASSSAPGSFARVQARAALELPMFASDAVSLTEAVSGVGVRVRPLGASSVQAEELDGALSFSHAFGDAHLLVTHDTNGFEDTTYFPTKPAVEEARYELRLENAAGLRLFDDVLEVLDATGTPQLRMSRPWVRDRFGEVHRLKVTLSGCAFDDSPIPPWRRPPTPPGADRCEIALDWRALELSYPAALDPAWATTGTITIARELAAMCANDRGQALLAGGNTVLGSPTDSAEMFDLATMTFSAIAPMGRSHLSPACVTLADGRFLFSGGTNITPIANAHVYDPATGAWSDSGMIEARSQHTLTLLPDGRVLAVAGFSGVVPLYSSAEVYDPATNSWTATDLLDSVRVAHAATLLPDGRVLVVGGNQNLSAKSELFDPTTMTWSLAADAFTAREAFPLLTIGGRAIAFGGGGISSKDWVESYDPVQDEWTFLASLPYPMEDHHVLPLPSGRVLLFGGTHDLGLLDGTFAYDPALDLWLDAGPGTERTKGLAVVMNDGSLLAAIGHGQPGNPVPLSALRFVESTLGSSCLTPGECETSVCRDGVCCDAACDGTCQRCNESGQCVVASSQDDPDSCTGGMSCDAFGLCKLALGASCEENDPCASGHCVDGVCCDRACDASCEACDGVSLGVCELVVGAPHGDRAECPEGFVCNGTTDECVELVYCEDEHFAVEPDGSLRDCSPYICSSEGACLRSCGSVFDCAQPFVCDAFGACVEPTSEPAETGCSYSSSRSRAGWWLAAALLALAGRARRARV